MTNTINLIAGLSHFNMADANRRQPATLKHSKSLSFSMLSQSLDNLDPRKISDIKTGVQLLKDNLGLDAVNIDALLNLNSVDKFLKQSGLCLSSSPHNPSLTQAREAISIWANQLTPLPAQFMATIIENSLPALKLLNQQYGLRLLDQTTLSELIDIGNAIESPVLFNQFSHSLASAWISHGGGFEFLYDFNDLSHDLALIDRLGKNSLPLTLGLLNALVNLDAQPLSDKATTSLSRGAVEILEQQLSGLTKANDNLKIPFANLDYMLTQFSNAVPVQKLHQAVNEYYHTVHTNPESQKQVTDLLDKFSVQWQSVFDSSVSIQRYAQLLENMLPDTLVQLESVIDTQLSQSNLQRISIHPFVNQAGSEKTDADSSVSNDSSVSRDKVTTKFTKEALETTTKAEKVFTKLEQIIISAASSPDFGRAGMAAEDAARSKTGILAAMTTTPRAISAGLTGFMTYLYATNAGELAGYGPYLEGLFASHYAGSTISNTATMLKPALNDNPIFEKITLARFGFLQLLDIAAIGYLNSAEDKPGRSIITAIATVGDSAALAKAADDVIEKPIKRIYYQAVTETLGDINVFTTEKKITNAVDKVFASINSTTSSVKFEQAILNNLDELNVDISNKKAFAAVFSEKIESKFLNLIKNNRGSHLISALINPLRGTAVWQNLMKSGPNAIALTLNTLSTMAWIVYDVKQSNSQFEAANNPQLRQMSSTLLGSHKLADTLLEQDGFVGANAAPTIMRLLDSIGINTIDKSDYLMKMTDEDLHGLVHTALLMDRTLDSIPDQSAKEIDLLAGVLETPTPTGFAFVLAPVPRLPESIAGLKRYAVMHFNLQLPAEQTPSNAVM